MAHYSSDCWDAEIFTRYGWIECVGIADRGCYDLSAHFSQTKQHSFKVHRPFADGSKTIQVLQITPNKSDLGKRFKQQTQTILQTIDQLNQQEISLQSQSSPSSSPSPSIICDMKRSLDQDHQIEIRLEDGSTVRLDNKAIKIETETQKITGEYFFPHVTEPSFGIGRILYSLLEHNYSARSDDVQRFVLRLPAFVAPYKCVVLPLLNDDRFAPIQSRICDQLAHNKIAFRVDDTNQSIGKRYARSDEIGIPFAITIDHQSLEDDSITLRLRDSMKQERIAIDSIALIVRSRSEDPLSFLSPSK